MRTPFASAAAAVASGLLNSQSPMRTAFWISARLVFVATAVACAGEPKPPPVLKITAPVRSLVQSQPGQVMVTGTATPSDPSDPIAAVTVNRVAARLGADGSFTAALDAPHGAMLLETVATSQSGASSTDTRAVQTGQLRAVGTGIDRAVTAALSADAFTRLSAAAGPLIKTMDLTALLAPLQPMVSAGNSLANLTFSVGHLAFADIHVALAPVAGSLSFNAQIAGLDVTGLVAFAGALVADGSTTVTATADQVTIAGTLGIAPGGMAGFTTQLASPTVNTVGLKLQAAGLTGQILDLLNSVLGSTINTMVSQVAERAMGPLINDALGALAGPQQVDVLGQKLDLQASPSTVAFSAAGAVVTMNLAAMLEGSESSPGYIFTDNGSPAIDASHGFQLGLADDLVNELLAEIHALGILDFHLQQDFGIFDSAQLQLTMPPMISANTSDGALRLVLGDMVGSFASKGTPIAKAAINAQVDLKIAPASTGHSVILQLGAVDLRVNLLDTTAGLTSDDLSSATSTAVGFQTDSLSELLIKIPLPSIAGLQFSDLSLHTDSGYVMVSGQIE